MRCSGGRSVALMTACGLFAALAGSWNPAYANGCGDGFVSPTEDCDPGVAGTNCCDPGTCLWTALNNPDPQAVCAAGIECQLDVCDGSGGCTTANVTNGTTCTDDGLFCTGVEECQNGARAGSGDPCASAGPCNNTCNGLTGDCFSPAGSACDDGLFCNGLDTCDGTGNCSVNAGNPCPVPADCDEVNDWCPSSGCGDGFVSPPEDCDPGVAGTNCCHPAFCQWIAAGAADPQGVCSGAPECQYDACDGAGGCTTGNVTAGTTCDDGDPCTDQTVCDGAGGCRGGVNLCGDAGVPDAAIADAGPADAAPGDGGPADAAPGDGGLQDGGPPDVAWFCDVLMPDAFVQQDGAPGVDAEYGFDARGRGGCSCRAGWGYGGVPSGDLFLVVLMFGLIVLLRRRRN